MVYYFTTCFTLYLSRYISGCVSLNFYLFFFIKKLASSTEPSKSFVDSLYTRPNDAVNSVSSIDFLLLDVFLSNKSLSISSHMTTNSSPPILYISESLKLYLSEV